MIDRIDYFTILLLSFFLALIAFDLIPLKIGLMITLAMVIINFLLIATYPMRSEK